MSARALRLTSPDEAARALAAVRARNAAGAPESSPAPASAAPLSARDTVRADGCYMMADAGMVNGAPAHWRVDVATPEERAAIRAAEGRGQPPWHLYRALEWRAAYLARVLAPLCHAEAVALLGIRPDRDRPLTAPGSGVRSRF